jgi:hypothetical protein
VFLVKVEKPNELLVEIDSGLKCKQNEVVLFAASLPHLFSQHANQEGDKRRDHKKSQNNIG